MWDIAIIPIMAIMFASGFLAGSAFERYRISFTINDIIDQACGVAVEPGQGG